MVLAGDWMVSVQVSLFYNLIQPVKGNRWFEGTSHAIYQNIDYIDSVNPEYVLILSGPHLQDGLR